MKNHLTQVFKNIIKTNNFLKKDIVLSNDIDFYYEFIPPYSKAKEISDIKLIIIGQDPTVRRKESRENIKFTLNLDKDDSLKKYINIICDKLQIDFEKEVYATNLYKCFFHNPPANDETILTRQFKIWMDFLINELSVFNNVIIVTLGEPLIKQLIHSNNREVKYYWNYIGNTESKSNFKFIESNENYLQKRIYPLPHQPSWSRIEFYHKYLTDYLAFIKREENK